MIITREGGILKSHDKKWSEEMPVLKFIWRKSPCKIFDSYKLFECNTLIKIPDSTTCFY